MGFISRKIFPVCGKMCVCCPALMSRSRHPVKRYKKTAGRYLPKNHCEYFLSRTGLKAIGKSSNCVNMLRRTLFRIPKIVKYLEERCYKELRNDHPKFVNIVMETYNKLLRKFLGQMS